MRKLWRHSDSLDEFEAVMSGLLRPCQIAGQARRRYRTEVLHGKLHRVGLTTVKLGGEAQVRVSAEKSLSLLQIPLRGSFRVVAKPGQSLEFKAGTSAHIVAADAPFSIDFQPGTQMLIVDLAAAQLEQIHGSRQFSRLARDLPSLPLTTPNAARMMRFFDYILGEMALDTQGHVTDKDLESALIGLLREMFSPQGNAKNLTAPPSQIMRRAMDYMQSHLDLDLCPETIAKALCISPRSLFRLFKDEAGTTPLAALKALRLDKVRRDILAGHVGEDGLTGIAMRCGFNHMGMFAASYRQRFGELPSQTLKHRTQA